MADETRLVAVFDANVTGFVKGMDDARAFSDKFFGNLQTKMQGAERQTTSSLGAIGGTLSKFLSVAAIEEFSRHVVTMTAGLIDQAKVLNVNISQLQTFRELLKDAGGSAEDADTILRKLTATIGAAQLEGANGGPAQDLFAHLGLGPGALKGNSADVLERVAKALIAIKDPTVRARLEVEAFGRSGQEFERVLAQVAAGIGPVTQKLREQGRIVDDGSAERAKAALDALAASWDQLEKAAAGPLSFIIKGFADLIDDAKQLAAILDKIPTDSDLLSGKFVHTPSAAATASPGAPSPLAGGGSTGAPFKTQEQIQEEKRAAEEAARFMKQLNGELNNFRKSLGENIGQAFTQAQKAARDAISATKDDAAQAADQLSVARNRTNVDLLQGTERAFDVARTLALDETNAQIAEIERRKKAQINALAEELKNETDFQDARLNVEAAANSDIAAARVRFLGDLAKIEEQQSHGLRDQIEAADGVRNSIVDIGLAALDTSKNFGQAVGDIIKQLALLIIKLELVKAVESQLGPTGTTLGGGTGGLSSIFSIGKSLLGFAGGGRPPVGERVRIGENGPETMVFDRPGTIIPNGGNLGGNVINIDARGAVEGTASQIASALKSVLPGFGNALIKSVKSNLPDMMQEAQARHL